MNVRDIFENSLHSRVFRVLLDKRPQSSPKEYKLFRLIIIPKVAGS